MIELLLTAALVAAAFGAGRFVQRLVLTRGSAMPAPEYDRAESFVLCVALGFGVLAYAVFALGALGWLYRGAVWAMVLLWGGLGVYGARQWWWRAWRPYLDLGQAWRRPESWVVAMTGLLLLLELVRALAPPHGATDPLAYQLALPKIFLLTHRLGFESTITGALYPSNMGLLYVVGLALRNGSVAQVLHWTMGVLTCVGIFACGRRLASGRAGIWGAAVFAAVPVVMIFAPQGYIDVGLGFFQFVALWALARWLQAPGRRALLLAALLTGVALGTKHQALATLVIAVPAIAVRRLWIDRCWRSALQDVALYLGVAGLLVSPWYLRAWLLAGNPVWPLANGLFDGVSYGQYASAETQGGDVAASVQRWLPSWQWLRSYADSMNPWKWTFEPHGWQKSIGVYFVGLLPGVLLLRRRRPVLLLAGFCVAYYVLLVRFLDMNPRYGLVLFAFAAVLAGMVVERVLTVSPSWVRALFLAGAALTGLCNLAWGYSLARPLLPVVTGVESREVFLARAEPSYRLYRHINQQTPGDARILLQGIVKGFYCDRPYQWDHPFQSELRYEDYPDPADLYRRLRELGITHVARLIQIPQGRLGLGYPQYFADPYHEAFRGRYLQLIYRDETYALFRLQDAGSAPR